VPQTVNAAPGGHRGGADDVGGSRAASDIIDSTSPASRQHRCLADVVAAAAAMAEARRVVHICRCPHCAELLILPGRPVAVALPSREAR